MEASEYSYSFGGDTLEKRKKEKRREKSFKMMRDVVVEPSQDKSMTRNMILSIRIAFAM